MAKIDLYVTQNERRLIKQAALQAGMNTSEYACDVIKKMARKDNVFSYHSPLSHVKTSCGCRLRIYMPQQMKQQLQDCSIRLDTTAGTLMRYVLLANINGQTKDACAAVSISTLASEISSIPRSKRAVLAAEISANQKLRYKKAAQANGLLMSNLVRWAFDEYEQNHPELFCTPIPEPEREPVVAAAAASTDMQALTDCLGQLITLLKTNAA